MSGAHASRMVPGLGTYQPEGTSTFSETREMVRGARAVVWSCHDRATTLIDERYPDGFSQLELMKLGKILIAHRYGFTTEEIDHWPARYFFEVLKSEMERDRRKGRDDDE